ncbi:MaoC family dehydratase N-terminal domain-containing protein [Sphingopyxis panaciterrae]
MALDRALIGHRSAPYQVDVERGQLAFFAKATGERNPVYLDESAARMAGHPAIPAPPTFAFTLSLNSPLTLEKLGADLTRILHGEQRFIHHETIYAGDRLELIDEVVDIYDRKGGALEFLVRRTRATNQHGALCVEATSTTVLRHD